ncbi:uncharacterized protein LOC119295088 [Triticum dicoccoides]|uniref:uncharacterized protein LOC119295088 n=1 Tax=Triticum dicoccoides TaxID=85692 RepID=UPI00188FE988|nr:uncharacterized protein LOC119295088 [Triticum dicoccoides]XP_044372408.1 uncharacterized protein LOC123094477 isoform X2 [Triticum aestivum]
METIGMATEDAASGGLEFLADPVDRFPLRDLGSGEAVLDAATTQTLVCAAAQSSVDGTARWGRQLRRGQLVSTKLGAVGRQRRKPSLWLGKMSTYWPSPS